MVTESHLKNLAFDLTKQCTIVDNSDSKNGHYIVSDGTIRFDAYSESQDYKVDECVRVVIPNNDFSQKKYITGKVVTGNSEQPISYVSPLGTVLQMSNNLVSGFSSERSLCANNKNKEILPLWSIDFTSNDYVDLINNNIYDTISVKGDFKTLLSGYKIASGNYGLKLVADIAPVGQQNATIQKIAYLDSSQMFGDPYAFSVYSTQEAKVNVAGLGNVRNLSLYLYQTSNFSYYDSAGARQAVPANQDNFGNYIDNIFVKNIYVGFGSDLINIADNTLEIYCTSALEFDTEAIDASTNTKEMGITWYNKDEDTGEYLGFSDGIYDPDYDEKAYLELINQNKKLIGQLGKTVPQDETGLRLSANGIELASLFEEMKVAIGTNLRNDVIRFENYISNVGDNRLSLAGIKALISELSAEIVKIGRDALATEAYPNNLLLAYNKYELKEESVYQKDENLISSLAALNQNFINLIGTILDYKTSANTIIKEYYSGYKYGFDTFDINTEQHLSDLENLINEYKEIAYDGNDLVLYKIMDRYFSSNYNYIATNYDTLMGDTSDFNNRYCIYWYQYVPGANDSIAGQGWNLISTNIGLPSEDELAKGFYKARPAITDTNYLQQVSLDSANTQEKFKVILFYNHEQFESNELVFTNLNPGIDEQYNYQTLVFIEHGKESRDNYQVYDSNGCLVNEADGSIDRYLKLRFLKTKDTPLEDDSDPLLANAQIFWYVPNHSTLLTYDKEVLSELGFESFNDGEMNREGYDGFYKLVRTDIDGNIVPDNRMFPYLISRIYNENFTNNTIYCKVKTGQYTEETSISFIFNTYGTSGTDYSLQISYAGSKTAFDNSGPLDLKVSLFDYDNEIVPVKNSFESGCAYLIDCKWEGTEEDVSYVSTEQEDGTLILSITNFDKDSYYNVLRIIVQAKVEFEDSSKIIDLTTYKPLAYSVGGSMYYIAGASTVIYDISGANPIYYKKSYELYRRNSTGGSSLVEDVNWSIDSDGLTGLLKSYCPKLSSDNRLIPSNLYISDSGLYPVVYGKNSNGTILWAQPIFIWQNRYAFSMLNSWDGNLTIDEKNGTILSTMVGAGRKNSSNQFEGILIGDVASADATSSSDKTGIGLYGYHNGAQSFCFNIDGTASIGKSGLGRIHFNGNTGTISSASYESTDAITGMKIDLDDGFIDMRGVIGSLEDGYESDGTQSHIRFDTKSPYVQIISQTGKPLFHIANDEYYLQTDNYIPYGEESPAGMKIDLQTGHIDAHDFNLTSKYLIMNSQGTIDSPYLQIKSTKQDIEKFLVHISNDKFFLQSVDDVITVSSGYGIENNSLSPYLRVKTKNLHSFETADGKIEKQSELLYMGPMENDKEAFYLQSYNFTEGQRAGTVYSEADVGISIYKSNTYYISYKDGDDILYKISESENYNPEEIYYIKSGNNYQVIKLTGNEDYVYQNKKFYIKSGNDFILDTSNSFNQDQNYYIQVNISEIDGAGIKLDLMTSNILAYGGFKLAAFKTENNYQKVLIDTTQPEYPLQIGLNGEFKVHWDGTFYAKKGYINGWNVSSYLSSYGSRISNLENSRAYSSTVTKLANRVSALETKTTNLESWASVASAANSLANQNKNRINEIIKRLSAAGIP